jgi:hypothetical protein
MVTDTSDYSIDFRDKTSLAMVMAYWFCGSGIPIP